VSAVSHATAVAQGATRREAFAGPSEWISGQDVRAVRVALNLSALLEALQARKFGAELVLPAAATDLEPIDGGFRLQLGDGGAVTVARW